MGKLKAADIWSLTWTFLKRQGWTEVVGKGLDDWYYVRPGKTTVKGRVNHDYFTNTRAVLQAVTTDGTIRTSGALAYLQQANDKLHENKMQVDGDDDATDKEYEIDEVDTAWVSTRTPHTLDELNVYAKHRPLDVAAATLTTLSEDYAYDCLKANGKETLAGVARRFERDPLYLALVNRCT